MKHAILHQWVYACTYEYVYNVRSTANSKFHLRMLEVLTRLAIDLLLSHQGRLSKAQCNYVGLMHMYMYLSYQPALIGLSHDLLILIGRRVGEGPRSLLSPATTSLPPHPGQDGYLTGEEVEQHIQSTD